MISRSDKDIFPLVSIITPSFNSMPYLVDNIESVLNQNYPNLEHIIIDGGSEDGTLDLLKSHAHLTWISEKDNGQSHALNKGFKGANGEFIGWLNSDDTYEPEAIIKIVRYLLDNPGIDLIYGNINIIDGVGKRIGSSYSKPFDLYELLSANFIKQPSVFMRKRVLDSLEGVNEELHYVMDRELWLRAGMNGFNIAYYESGFLANFRICPGTKSFENSVGFAKEWNLVLNRVFHLPFFQHISQKVKKRLLSESKSTIYFTEMMKSGCSRPLIIINFFKSVYYNRKMLTNAGAWSIMLLLLLGNRPDRLRKYRKQFVGQQI